MIKGYMDADGTGMNCNCARDEDREKQQKMCLGNGNYNPKQKDGEDPFCVDQDGFFTKKSARMTVRARPLVRLGGTRGRRAVGWRSAEGRAAARRPQAPRPRGGVRA
ncbi:Protein of unknown function, partial [Gryllus bimaculatus]